MITLYQFPPCWGLLNASPFCMKLEVYLKLCQLPYKTKYVMDPAKSPKGKLPFIKDGEHVIADSGFAIEYLKNTYGDALDAHLTAKEKAVCLAMSRMIEEHLYWAALYSRWIDEENWPLVKTVYFSGVPFLVRYLVATSSRKAMRKELWGHGMGRHTQDEIYQLGVADLVALHDYLGDKPFFMGDKPTSLDASAYAFLANIMKPPVKSPLSDYANSQSTFQDYLTRMAGLM